MLRKIREARENEEGFTLIELLVVVIIIGILAAIAIPVFLNQRESAYRSAAESDARNAAMAIETYFTSENAYPTSTSWAGGATGDAFDLDGDGVDDITVSENVTLTYAVGSPATTYTIKADHTQLSQSITYNSATGGLGDWTASP